MFDGSIVPMTVLCTLKTQSLFPEVVSVVVTLGLIFVKEHSQGVRVKSFPVHFSRSTVDR